MVIQHQTNPFFTLFKRRISFATTPELPSVAPVVPASVPMTEQGLNLEGKNEQKISVAAKKEEDKQVVNDLIKKSNRSIMSIYTHFPWTWYPNTIQVEEGRITLTFRQFLASQTHSVDIKDISNVLIESSPFFATITIVSRTFQENTISIGHLRKTEAYRVQMIIEGLRTLNQHKVDTSVFDIPALISKIEAFQTNSLEN